MILFLIGWAILVYLVRVYVFGGYVEGYNRYMLGAGVVILTIGTVHHLHLDYSEAVAAMLAESEIRREVHQLNIGRPMELNQLPTNRRYTVHTIEGHAANGDPIYPPMDYFVAVDQAGQMYFVHVKPGEFTIASSGRQYVHLKTDGLILVEDRR